MIVFFSLARAEIIDPRAFFVPERLGNVSLYHDDSGFSIESSLGIFSIQPWFVDKLLRGITKEKLVRLLAAGAYLAVAKIGDGDEYSLKLKGRLNGGGPGGATAGFYIGKFLTHFVAHSAILVAGALTGPAAPATILSLEATFGPAIEAASNGVGLGCGLLGAVATGPV